MERNNNSSYIQKGDRDRCENYRRIALGNANDNILANIVFEKIRPYIEKITTDYHNGFRDGRSVIDNVFVLKIINEKIWKYNQCTIYIYCFSKGILFYTQKQAMEMYGKLKISKKIGKYL